MLDSKSEIDEFLVLSEKSDDELKTIAESLSLPSNQSREVLIKSILGKPKRDITDQPQVLALVTRRNGKSIPGAAALIKEYRELIFNENTQYGLFSIANDKGKVFSYKLPYIKALEYHQDQIFNRDIYIRHEFQEDFIQRVRQNPQQFEFNFICKKTDNGNSWVMLHIQKKEAA